MPKTYTFWGILTGALVSLPAAMIGLYYSNQAKSKHLNGDYKAAAKASKYAKSFSLYLLVLAFSVAMVYSIISGDAFEAMQEGYNDSLSQFN